MGKHTREELRQWQALPLEVKILMTCQRIRDWVNTFKRDGVYVSFSGGKDSTVLLDLVRNRCGYKDIPAVFVDVPTQYPELRDFAKTWDNVEILKPKMSFMQVCERYGFPLISKEVSEIVHNARIYLRLPEEEQKKRIPWYMNKLTGVDHYIAKDGTNKHSSYSAEKWQFMLHADYEIGSNCCYAMKKSPLKAYEKRTGRVPMIAIMADESRLRETNWIENGCNIYDGRHVRSTPMAFWTEQDVLQYIYENKLPICSVYGEIIRKDKQMTFDEVMSGQIQWEYETTGAKRTGCMLCGFGCHLEKSPNRFERLKETHPKMYAMLDVVKNNGYTMRQAIEWMNENGGTHIKL